MNKDTLERKIKRLDDALDQIESGKYSELSISYISDQIVWLRKFKHISKEESDRLCNRVIYCLDNRLYQFYK